MSKKIAILQSNYIPWKGYFDLIGSVDTFVFYDEMQYTKRDWRNRNKIKTRNGLEWLSIPVSVKGKYNQKISETLVIDGHWARSHWKTIKYHYHSAPYFNEYSSLFEGLYNKASTFKKLVEINHLFIKEICKILGINTKIIHSNQFKLSEKKTKRLVDICVALTANQYISGPSAKDYLDIELFRDNNINLKFINYSGYKEYNQLYGKFEHNVSIIDLLFNEGPRSIKFINNDL